MQIRDATAEDLPAVVALLADDPRGREREDASLPLAASYLDAFAAIERAPDQRLLVGAEDGRVVGCLQLSFLPGLSSRGAWRGQIEAVRIVADRRGQGLGQQIVSFALDACRNRGCTLAQLTSDNARLDAHRFWERQGFRPSRKGFKLDLGSTR